MLVLLKHSLLIVHVVAHVLAWVIYLVPESSGKLFVGAELDQGSLENQVLCMMRTDEHVAACFAVHDTMRVQANGATV